MSSHARHQMLNKIVHVKAILLIILGVQEIVGIAKDHQKTRQRFVQILLREIPVSHPEVGTAVDELTKMQVSEVAALQDNRIE